MIYDEKIFKNVAFKLIIFVKKIEHDSNNIKQHD